MQERYGKNVAAAICGELVLPEALDVRDDGVYVSDEYQKVRDAFFVWNPPCDMDWPDSPDPLGAPSLPIPFTAAELAAFMLHGVGASFQEIFGPFGDPPREKALAALGVRAVKVRKALREAYSLARQAQEIVGKLDQRLQQQADELMDEIEAANLLANEREGVFNRAETKPQPPVKRPKVNLNDIDFTQTGKRLPPELMLPVRSMRIARSAEDDEMSARRERAIASYADLEATANNVATRAKVELEDYRKAMVRQLLQPRGSIPDITPLESDAKVYESATVAGGSASGCETTEQRQERRYQACIDAGLTMPNDDYAHLPRGIGKLAKAEGIERQSFSEDLKAHIRRINGR
jgi:hypothetical protein